MLKKLVFFIYRPPKLLIYQVFHIALGNIILQTIFETVVDQSDAIPLCPRLNLFLKPFARILITVQLDGKTKTTISNWQIMERLKEWIDPDKFSHLCVAKTSSELIRLVGIFKVDIFKDHIYKQNTYC